MPIGLTASGEIVFPIQCRELIERQRGKAVEQKPAVDEKPIAVEEKPAVKQSEDVAPKNSQPAIKPVETVLLPKRVEHKPRERAMSSDDANCSRYHSYDPASGTYTGYDGQRHSCRWVQVEAAGDMRPISGVCGFHPRRSWSRVAVLAVVFGHSPQLPRENSGLTLAEDGTS
jgi:hypothetical protein